MIDCKARTGIIMGAIILGSLGTITGCGRSGPASTDASRTAPTAPATSPVAPAKLRVAIQKAQAQGRAMQAAAAAHPHIPARVPSAGN